MPSPRAKSGWKSGLAGVSTPMSTPRRTRMSAISPPKCSRPASARCSRASRRIAWSTRSRCRICACSPTMRGRCCAAWRMARLSKLFLMFPDPWPKARHAKRRFVHPELVAEAARALRQGGEWRIASDDPTYQEWTDEVLAAQDLFTVTRADHPARRLAADALRGQGHRRRAPAGLLVADPALNFRDFFGCSLCTKGCIFLFRVYASSSSSSSSRPNCCASSSYSKISA